MLAIDSLSVGQHVAQIYRLARWLMFSKNCPYKNNGHRYEHKECSLLTPSRKKEIKKTCIYTENAKPAVHAKTGQI